MRSSMLTLLTTTAFSLMLPVQTYAEEAGKSKLEAGRRIIPLEVLITRGRWAEEEGKYLPGASYYVGKSEMEKNTGGDVHKVMKQVPGVNVQEEDGFGLRPNIGMRGGRVSRSADITLMEDGVLIAPAPYASPDAYFFPRMERMEGAEVRKGASAIQYGPRTTNGALNLLSKSIPDRTGGEASLSAGSYGSVRGNTTIGSTAGNFGAMLHLSHGQSDGFKDVDFVGTDTGFSIQDSLFKLRYKTDATAPFHQEFEFKGGYTKEISDETYLGLTDADFAANPNRRYASSQLDEMDAEHNQFQFSHYIEPTNNTSLTTTLYRNRFDREWYRLQAARIDGVSRNINDILDNPAANALFLDVLRNADSGTGTLQVRSNARTYDSFGAQTEFNIRQNTGPVRHDVKVGLRIHSDEEDRFQREDTYNLASGVMQLVSRGAPGSESNRIGSADAIAVHALNRMEMGNLAVTPGFRYEYVELTNEDYGKADPARTGANLVEYNSTIRAFVPGIGLEYQLSPQWEVLAGVHKGFAPPAPPGNATSAANAREEESTNYEAGLRFKQDSLRAEAIGFFTDYKNLLGRDTFAAGGAGGGGGTGDQFNGGAVEVYGLEASLKYDVAELLPPSRFRYPVKATYTYTQTEFQSSFNSSFSEWGNVRAGDELPYIAPHQLYVSAGVEDGGWKASIGAKYMAEMRTVAGSGPLREDRKTDANTVFDLNGEYELVEGVRAFGTVQNLFDEEYIAARRPAGLRPGAPQILFAGVKASF